MTRRFANSTSSRKTDFCSEFNIEREDFFLVGIQHGVGKLLFIPNSANLQAESKYALANNCEDAVASSADMIDCAEEIVVAIHGQKSRGCDQHSYMESRRKVHRCLIDSEIILQSGTVYDIRSRTLA